MNKTIKSLSFFSKNKYTRCVWIFSSVYILSNAIIYINIFFTITSAYVYREFQKFCRVVIHLLWCSYRKIDYIGYTILIICIVLHSGIKNKIILSRPCQRCLHVIAWFLFHAIEMNRMKVKYKLSKLINITRIDKMISYNGYIFLANKFPIRSCSLCFVSRANLESKMNKKKWQISHATLDQKILY